MYIENGILIKQLYTNAGHSFGNITQSIYHIFNSNIDLSGYTIIIPEDLLKNNFLSSLIFLFFDKEKVFILKEKMKINIKKTYIIKDHSYKDDKAIDFLLNKLKLTINNNLVNQIDNVFLIKSDITKNTTNGSFNISYNNFFKLKGFECIIPENYDILQLFYIIYNAKNVIMSWGCCSYLNSVFVNKNANILVISNIKYKNEYETVINTYDCGLFNSAWFPKKCNKKLFLGDLTDNLTDEIIEKLNGNIKEMET